jgi:hypothetical protein
MSSDKPDVPDDSSNKWKRAGMNAAAGLIPFVGGVLSAAAGAWSESEQETINKVFRQWMQMLEEELKEKSDTIIDIMARLDMQDAEIKKRVESSEYQSLLKKAFRNWSEIDTAEKRKKMRNLLSNSAASQVASDDVVRLFIDWIGEYSDFHFEVVGEIYRNPGITRAGIWENLQKPDVREDSAEADLFRLLIRQLSLGGVIRQARDTDNQGRFLRKQATGSRKSASPYMKSTFDDKEQYVLTDLGDQFIHYVMNELVLRVEFKQKEEQKEQEVA